MHRDYSHYSGYVAIAVFDDRIEFASYGRLPTGITVKQLSGKHRSKAVNPLIAGAFHRIGAVEVWGRGTNRVIEMCRKHGAAPPTFEEHQGFLVVTFGAQLVAGGPAATARAQSQPESQPGSQPESLRRRVLALLQGQTLGKAEISARLGQRSVSGQLTRVIRALIDQGLIECTLPDKPNSRLQKYRLTPAGEKAMKERSGEGGK